MKKLKDLNTAKEYIRERSDLVSIIESDAGELDWTEEGSGTLITNSPFRNEENPSFKVSGNRFKDWGGEQHSGDVFAWAQIWHGISFVESIFHVANKAGLDLTEFLKDPTPEELQESKYRQANKIAAEFMHQMLRDNATIRNDYLIRSGFTLDQIAPYQVGYCPTSDVLVNHVTKNIALNNDELFKLEFGRKDLFTNAIVYPVHNPYGDVIGFYTRQLGVEGAPYMGNKSDHPLHDPDVLYGMHVARKNLRGKSQLVVSEGFRDSIAVGSAGAMGSAITKKQLSALSNYKISSIILLYDGDYTGWTKTLDLINKPDEFGKFLVLVARPPIDEDPHDVWRREGNAGIEALLTKARIPLEFYVDTNYDTSKPLSLTEQHTLLNSLQQYLTKVSGVQLDIAINYLSHLLSSSRERINDYVAEIKAEYSQLFNLEAERTLISSCMRHSSSYSAALSAGIFNNSFTLSAYKKLFEGCIASYYRFGDAYTPQNVLDETMAIYADQELIATTTTVLTDTYKYTEIASCEIVLDMWRRRTASDQASDLITKSRDLATPFVNIVEGFRKNLVTTTTSIRKQPRTPQELADELLAKVKERELAGGNLIVGHDFYSMPCLNMALGGIQPAHMITLAGDTGAGKSIAAMNIAHCLAVEQGIPTLWIGQEMVSYENMMRLASIISGISNTRIQSGSLDQLESIRFMDAVKKIHESQFYMAKPHMGTIDEIIAIVDEYRWKHGIQVLIWDYIGLIQAAEWQMRWSREQIIGYASKVVANQFAVDMGLAAIILAQLNRDKMSEGKHKVAGSFQIAQDSHDFMYISKKTKQQKEKDGITRGNRYLHIDKRRGGASDYRLDAYLDEDPRHATLVLQECSTPSQQTDLYTKLAS